MQERILSKWTELKEKWNTLERKQQYRIILVAVSLMLAIGLAIYIMVRPKYVPLTESTLSMQEMTLIQGLLDDNGIPNKRSPANRGILVRERDLADAEFFVMSSDINLPDDFTLSSAISSVSMSTTSSMIDEVLIDKKKADIRRMIRSLKDVEDADVLLDLPKNRVFALQNETEGSASVSLQTARTLSRREGEVIAGMVAGGYMDLKKENVTVTDQNGNVLYAGISADSIDGAMSYRKEYETIVKSEMAADLKRHLSPYGSVSSMLNLVFDYTDVSEESVYYENPYDETDNRGLISEQTVDRSSGTTINADAEPGAEANDLEDPNYLMQNGESSSVEQSSESTQYLHNANKITTSSNNAGRLIPESSSISVRISTPTTYRQSAITPEELGGLTWEQFKDANVFPVTEDAPENIVQQVRLATGLDNVVVSIVREPVFVDTEVRSIPYETIIILVILAIFMILLAYGLIKKTQPDEVTEIEPELSVEDLLVSTQLEEEKESDVQKLKELQEIEFQEDSDIKKQIVKFVDEKPEAVAQLLRNWINDDWD